MKLQIPSNQEGYGWSPVNHSCEEEIFFKTDGFARANKGKKANKWRGKFERFVVSDLKLRVNGYVDFKLKF